MKFWIGMSVAEAAMRLYVIFMLVSLLPPGKVGETDGRVPGAEPTRVVRFCRISAWRRVFFFHGSVLPNSGKELMLFFWRLSGQIGCLVDSHSFDRFACQLEHLWRQVYAVHDRAMMVCRQACPQTSPA